MSLYLVLAFFAVLFFTLRLKAVFLFTVLFLTILIVRSGVFIVNEGSQVVLTQFGKVIGKPYTQAGIYLKIPFLWKANYFDRRIFTDEDLQVDVATKDAYFISVDTIVNWRISNATRFFEAMDNTESARVMLKNMVSGSVREIVSKHKLVDTVRAQNINLDPGTFQVFSNADHTVDLGLHSKVDLGRAQLSKMMKDQVYKYELKYGIEVLAILIKHIGYTPPVQQAIFERMVLERLVKAEELRSTGRKNYQRIMGEIKRKYQSIVAPAKKNAELIKGKADAGATKIYAESYGQNEVFFNFWRTLIAYEESIPFMSQGAILSTESDFLKLISDRNFKNKTHIPLKPNTPVNSKSP